MKKMSVEEFRSLGFLQEVNRQFLHPRGLALEVIIDDKGKESFGEVRDSRNDPEGIYYDLKNSDNERVNVFKGKAEIVEEEKLKHVDARVSLLGSEIEPI